MEKRMTNWPTKLAVAIVAMSVTYNGLAQDEVASAASSVEEGSVDEGIRLNFRGVPLTTVLEYMSQAAGFAIVMDTEVSGEVNVWSAKPLSKEEAVELLNTLLADKGYAAIRSGNTLKIVGSEAAKTDDLPVKTGRDPEAIPKSDSMVTQIIPVRYAEANQLIEDIAPLIPEGATVTANVSSNAVVLTDTQTSIRRITEIIRALDTSIAGISAIRVFPLRYSDATELAKVIEELFEEESSSSRSRGRSGGSSFFDRFRGRGGDSDRGGSSRSSSGDSEALQAASRVVAVADERTNSLVVSAPDELIPTIEQLVSEIDTNVDDITALEVFPLENADASEMSEMLTNLFSDTDSSQAGGSFRFGGGRPSFFGGGPSRGGGSRGRSDDSDRVLMQKRVVAVPDQRTNSVIVSASRDMMDQIGRMVAQLDKSSKRKQRVHVYKLEHADVENVAGILQGLFEEQAFGTAGGANNRNTVGGNTTLQNRANNGATLGQQSIR